MKGIFVAATKQHVGKTTVSLALMSALVKRFGKKRVGFIKPVGQQHELSPTGVQVDKDVSLMKEYFGLSCDYNDMSPVIIPSGYTKDFIDGKVTMDGQLKKLHRAYENLSKSCDILVAEGTGHTGVGSIVQLNNAQVASRLGSGMVLVANGGLGSSFDELTLNYQMCKEEGVRILGIVLNKVKSDKVEMISEYFEKLLKPWGVPLLGVVPDEEYLGRPSFSDLEKVFKTSFISGHSRKASLHHFSTDELLMVATDLNNFLKKLQDLPQHPLIITHQTRNDILLGFAAHVKALQSEGIDFGGGVVITGTKRGELSEYMEDLLVAQDLPALLSHETTFRTMDRLRSYTPKLHKDDKVRLDLAVKHYEPHIDVDKLLASL